MTAGFGLALTVEASGARLIRGMLVEFDHQRFLAGEGAGFLGVWDREDPEEPVAQFPANDDGLIARDSYLITHVLPIQSPEFGQAWRVPTSGPYPITVDERTFTRLERERFLVGWGVDFFGVWDREHPDAPLALFPETLEGNEQAWDEWMRLRQPGPAPMDADVDRAFEEAARIELESTLKSQEGPDFRLDSIRIDRLTDQAQLIVLFHRDDGEGRRLGYHRDFWQAISRQEMSEPPIFPDIRTQPARFASHESFLFFDDLMAGEVGAALTEEDRSQP